MIPKGNAKGGMRPREMNRNETAYADHLRQLMLVGEIRWFDFECMKLRLADNTFYTPDFTVLNNLDELEQHEVKGATKIKRADGSLVRYGAWSEEDANIKIKVAADQFPFRFIRTFFVKGQGWQLEEISRGAATNG